LLVQRVLEKVPEERGEALTSRNKLFMWMLVWEWNGLSSQGTRWSNPWQGGWGSWVKMVLENDCK